MNDSLKPFPERRSEQLTFRLPKSALARVRGLARLWTAIERWRTGDKEAEVTQSDAALRILETGLKQSWEQLGMKGMPETEHQWEELLARAFEAAKVKYQVRQQE